MKKSYPPEFWQPRNCFLEPIPEMQYASELLSRAVDAILAGDMQAASRFILEADMPELEAHNNRVAGSTSVEVHRLRPIPASPETKKCKKRMPPYGVELSIYKRDGWRCRFCQTRVISKDARKELNARLPNEARWGKKNIEKHRGLSVLESSLDHLLPHNRGGDNELLNLVTACGPCQFGRGGWTIEEVGIANPFNRAPIVDGWDGLRRLVEKQG